MRMEWIMDKAGNTVLATVEARAPLVSFLIKISTFILRVPSSSQTR